MNHHKQKFIQTTLFALVMTAGFGALNLILRTDNLFLFVRVSVYLYVYMAVSTMLLYDLHFKAVGVMGQAKERHQSVEKWLERTIKVLYSALYVRSQHLLHWQYFRHYLHYLILPAFLYWATVGLLSVNFLHAALRLSFSLLTVAALVVVYWYLKEIFHRQKERVDQEIIGTLTVVKLYVVFLVYSAVLGIGHYYCLPGWIVALAGGIMSFSLLYQALFQYDRIAAKSISASILVSVALGVQSFYAYNYWGITNYFTAGVLLMAWYNFFWGILHHFVVNREKFNLKVLVELLAVTIIISLMMVGVTNFKARITNAC